MRGTGSQWVHWEWYDGTRIEPHRGISRESELSTYTKGRHSAILYKLGSGTENVYPSVDSGDQRTRLGKHRLPPCPHTPHVWW